MNKQRKTFRPSLENLEDRRVMTTMALVGPLTAEDYAAAQVAHVAQAVEASQAQASAVASTAAQAEVPMMAAINALVGARAADLGIQAVGQRPSTNALPDQDLAKAPTLGQKMVDFLRAKLNTRVGGGECAHLATEALRAAGADFTRTEPSGTQDYVWTTNRVARLTSGSQLAGKRFQVGDIIQFNNARFSSGGTSKLAHHTQVVAAVDSNGRITKVYEQNVNGNRTVQLRTTVDLSKLNGGSVSIYRAVARTTQKGLLEYTIVNNTSSSRNYTVQIGSSTFNKTLGKANTETSYKASTTTFSGSVTPKLTVGTAAGQTVTIQNGAAYELYTMSNGKVGIRKI